MGILVSPARGSGCWSLESPWALVKLVPVPLPQHMGMFHGKETTIKLLGNLEE